jgi:serine/threonine protein kinase
MEDWKLAKQNIWLNVPLELQDNPVYARDLEDDGAKFQPKRRSWYVPRGVNPLPFINHWGPLRKVFRQDRKDVKALGATLDPNMERYVAPGDPLEFFNFLDFWPQDLKKFVFNDRFFAFKQLSGGGQAEVYRAIDTQAEAEVAVKLYAGAQTSDEVLAAFSRECDILHNVLNGCDGALQIIDYGQHPQSQGLFLVMPWLATMDEFINLSKSERIELYGNKGMEAGDWDKNEEGYEEEYERLYDLVATLIAEEDHKPQWDREKEDLMEILEALVKVYNKGVLHRDIKPSNIFIDFAAGAPHWILGDFGASKSLEHSKSSGATLAHIATEPYGPARSRKEMQHQETWDVFGWGAVTVTLICDEIFTETKRLHSALHGEFKVRVPQSVFEVVKKCLSEEPELRWKNVKELKKALSRADKMAQQDGAGSRQVEQKKKPSLAIDREEGKHLEFKASLRRPYPDQEPQVDDEGQRYWLWGKEKIKSKKAMQTKLEQQILKTVAAFYNTKGGDLYIGIHEKDNKKEYVGIEYDGFTSGDKYLLHLKNLLKNGLEDQTILADLVNFEIVNEAGHELCLIKVEPKPEDRPAVFLKTEDFVYVRQGNSTEGYTAKQYEKLRHRQVSKWDNKD